MGKKKKKSHEFKHLFYSPCFFTVAGHLCEFSTEHISPVFNFQSGADINAKDMLKMTALHWAAQHGHHGVAETLIKHGADVHALSKFDKTPFDIAVDIQNTELMLLLQVSARRTSLCMIYTRLI